MMVTSCSGHVDIAGQFLAKQAQTWTLDRWWPHTGHMAPPESDQNKVGDPLIELRRELVRLRGGRALADLSSLLRLGDGFWSVVPPRGVRPVEQAEVIRAALTIIQEALLTLDDGVRRYAQVELNVDDKIHDSDLGERQQALADELSYSVKTVRRRGNEAIYSLALRLLDLYQGQSASASNRRPGPLPTNEPVNNLRSASLERFWGISSRHRVDIVCSELPAKIQPYYANPRDRNYLRYAKFADLDSLVYVRTRLAELFPHCYVRDFSASEYSDSHADHLIVLGGPDWNKKAGEFQEYLPIKFFWDEDKKETFLTVDDEPMYPKWSPSNSLICEYAMFARLRLRQGLTVSLMWGCLTYGVLGATHCFLDPTVVQANVEFVESVIGTPSFAILTTIREFGGIVQPPDLRTDTIAAYKSDVEFSANFTRVPLSSE